MTSEKQIAANQRNALKSTGPTTPEGKLKTRLNALRDGFTGQVISLSVADLPYFKKFKSDFITDLAPKTTMELSLADAIAWDTWRLNHLRAVEMNTYAIGTQIPSKQIESDLAEFQTAIADAETFQREAPRFALMSIYEQRLTRNLHKNAERLQALQTERKQQFKEDREEQVVLARASDLKGLPYEAPAEPTENGSVFSTPEIQAAANRLTTFLVAKSHLWKSDLKVQYAGAGGASSGNATDWPNQCAA